MAVKPGAAGRPSLALIFWFVDSRELTREWDPLKTLIKASCLRAVAVQDEGCLPVLQEKVRENLRMMIHQPEPSDAGSAAGPRPRKLGLHQVKFDY